jgi:hypothetical protein
MLAQGPDDTAGSPQRLAHWASTLSHAHSSVPSTLLHSRGSGEVHALAQVVACAVPRFRHVWCLDK